MKKLAILMLLIFIPAGMFTSCKKDKGDPPVLPPVESMAIDFSNFETSGKSDIPVPEFKGSENSTWLFAAGVAMIWKGVLVATLAVPVTAYQTAITKTPVYLEKGKWQWSYDVTITLNQISMTYKARLTGHIQTNNVVWEMYISKEGTNPFPEFLWFSGTSKIDGTGGQWIVNHSAQYQEPVLQIDWTKSGALMGSVKYTYIRTLNDNRETDPFKNSYIEYGLTSNTLNAYYEINYYNFTLQQFVSVEVEWSTSGKNGRVKSPVWFGNEDWYCWDGNYNNVEC